jgi:AcrR family transcriptional regulator
MIVQTRTLLDVATRVLVADPAASLGDVAAAAGVSRTTLHSRFPTRHALLVALAEEALTLVEQALEDSGIEAADAEDVRVDLRRVEELAEASK